MERSELERIVTDERLNTLLAWALVAFLVGVSAANLATRQYLWAGFAAVVAAVALVPAATLGNARAMLPWEVLALAALPLLGPAAAAVVTPLAPLLAETAGDLGAYLSVAALALIIAVELQMLTAVRMNYRFAVAFVVIATMATAGIWAVVRWVPDVLVGTTFILEPGVPEETIEHRLMLEFVYSTMAGVAGGIVFELYFRRRARISERLPT